MVGSAQAQVPKGEVTKYTFDQSKIFPGTTRDVWVYVPAQYDASKPACVHVNQDGVQFNAPKVFDDLIAAKKMPVTIGVFVMHGRVAATDPKAALDRFNRSYEYDGLGDGYARFLLNELLPWVETKTATDGRKILLSKSGNDRCIAGTSSGAIAAFTAAWERPDAFSRVFSGIGTYVGLRGGHNYSTLIRKTEPKPIRVFLEDGSGDLNIYGGDWWMANQAMERALTFAGYEVKHDWGTGGHSGKHSTELFPEAVEWLWKGWPEPVKAGKGSPQLQEILLPGEDWKLVGEGYQFTEGPAADPKGDVYFCDVPKSIIYKLDATGKPQPWSTASNRASGLAFAPDGTLFSAGGSGVQKFDAAGTPTKVESMGNANDLTLLPDGRVYASVNGVGPQKRGGVELVAGGQSRLIDSGLGYANGLTTSPDKTLLYVADSRSHWVYSYQIQADGTLKYKQKYFHLHAPDTADDAAADGLRCDRDGRLWVATRMGLQVCDQPGRVNCIIPTPNGQCSNLCFGGKDSDTVYVTANEKVYARKVKVKGAHGFDPASKPKKPGL
jgi:gluconolactonase